MIFCEEPWCNEPGRETMQRTEASKRFNRGLYESTVKYAMLEWIEGKKSLSPPPKQKRSVDWPGSAYDYSQPSVSYFEPAQATLSTNVDVFADVAKKHFENNRVSVVSTVKEWVKEKKSYGTAEAAKKADLLPENVSLMEYLTTAPRWDMAWRQEGRLVRRRGNCVWRYIGRRFSQIKTGFVLLCGFW